MWYNKRVEEENGLDRYRLFVWDPRTQSGEASGPVKKMQTNKC